jgi:phosphoadenosine phosphosulfate reductase
MALVNATFSANPLTLPAHLACAEAELAGADPATIVTWALSRAARPVLTTNFRPGAAALVHLVTRARPDIPVIWVDTGYNTPATYRYVDALRDEWNLDLRIYTPRLTVARQAAFGGPPRPDAQSFARFVRETKLEPFERAFNELKPDVWFTGIRREQTEFRSGLAVVSRGASNTLRVAPLLEWNEIQVARYLKQHAIPDNDDYADPTKPGAKLECGLQLLR